MTTRITRLDRLQRGLVDWAEALLPTATVVWAPSVLPREIASSSLVSFELIAGPRSAGSGSRGVSTYAFPTLAHVDVGAVTTGASVTISLSGIRISHRVTAGQTPEQVRDALRALCIASDVAATFAASGTNRIVLTPTSLGDVYNLRVSGPLTLTTVTSAPAKAQVDEVTYAIDMQIRSKSRYPMDGAMNLMSAIKCADDLPVPNAILEAFGLSVEHYNPINLNGLAGPDWESRASLELQVSQVSVAAATETRMQTVAARVVARTESASFDLATSVVEP